MNAKIFGGLAALLILVGSVFAVSAATNISDSSVQGLAQACLRGNQVSDELMEKIDAAIESENYSEWLSLHQENSLNVPENISAENFPLLKELKGLRERMQEIHKELGFSERGGKGFRQGFGGGMHGRGMHFNADDSE